MTAMTLESARAIRLITRREVSARLFSKAFVVGILTTVVLIFAVFGLGRLLGGDDEIAVGLAGVQPSGAVEALQRSADRSDTALEVVRFDTAADAEVALEAGEVDGVVVDGVELRMADSNDDLVALVTPAWQQAALIGALGDNGLADGAIADALRQASPLTIVEVDPDPESGDRDAIAFFSVVLLFIAIQVASAYILMGVFEEKSTKVVELVLSSVRARHLLLGKIIGVGVLGLIQVIVLAGSALAAATIFGSSSVPTLTVGLLGAGVIWFVLGYLLYGSVIAAGASLAPRQEDAQSTLGPVSVVLMLSYFGALFAASDPASTVSGVLSWVPLTAPFVMPGRIASGDVASWEVLASMGVTALAAAIVLRLAEHVYVRSVIHTDRKLGWREAWALEG